MSQEKRSTLEARELTWWAVVCLSVAYPIVNSFGDWLSLPASERLWGQVGGEDPWVLYYKTHSLIEVIEGHVLQNVGWYLVPIVLLPLLPGERLRSFLDIAGARGLTDLQVWRAAMSATAAVVLYQYAIYLFFPVEPFTPKHPHSFETMITVFPKSLLANFGISLGFEIVFRLFLFAWLSDRLGWKTAFLVSISGDALTHMYQGYAPAMHHLGNAAIMCYYAYRYRTILPCIVSHCLTNLLGHLNSARGY